MEANWLRLDFETASELELTEYGLYNYANHPTTRPLMLAYKFGDEPVELHEFYKGPLPERVLKALADPNQILTAFNSAFERAILQYCLGIIIPPSRFQDPQASARYLSLPADLETVGEVLHLGPEFQKDKRGESLIKLFCEPVVTKAKKETKKSAAIESRTYFNNWESHPKEWLEFCEYCKQDVIAEEEVARRLNMLGVFPLPPNERRIWIFDQNVNDRGIPVSRQFIQNMHEGADESKQEALADQNKITGLENSNSAAQLLPWAKQRGYPRGTLRKEVIDLILKDSEINLTPTCREVLTKRKEAASTTYKKLVTMLRHAGADGRLRNQFIYMGSSRCGRWSSGASQLHNMARPNSDFESVEYLNWGRSMFYAKDYQAVKLWFGSVLLTVKNLIRTVFEVENSLRFNVCDLNAIETRVGAWVAECTALNNVFIPTPEFPKGRDPYLDFGEKMTGIPFNKLWADYKSGDITLRAIAKAIRQMAKPGVLGAIYRLGGGGWGFSKNGYKDHDLDCDADQFGKKYCKCPTVRDRIKTGLWGYAENMGITMTLEDAHKVVRVFRSAYPEIGGVPDVYSGFEGGIWYRLENAVKDVLREGAVNVIRKIGPNNCITIDKLIIKDRGNILRIQLPSGRYLHYMDARIENTLMPWKTESGEDVYRPALVYAGINQDTHQWEDFTTSHGGKIFENIVQGIARDVLAEKLLEIDALGIMIVAHVHDEGIGITDDDPFSPGVKEMEHIMSQPVSWAPGLLLAADGFESKFYHK